MKDDEENESRKDLVEDHEDYHEPTDDYEKVHKEFYIEAVRVIISVFEKIDDLRF